jgi:hypothetical protein
LIQEDAIIGSRQIPPDLRVNHREAQEPHLAPGDQLRDGTNGLGAAHPNDFIQNPAEGGDRVVGKRGGQLSVGERRQRQQHGLLARDGGSPVEESVTGATRSRSNAQG